MKAETEESVKYLLLVAMGTLLTFLSSANRAALAEACVTLTSQLEVEKLSEEGKACLLDIKNLLNQKSS